ncbi:hypothetical protein EW028_10955 [Lysinibacillus sp. OL1]|nr:hypothetical protein EW028_10955 [Lysinibacillus sp. OL1]
MLINKAINSIYIKDENEFPLQATCFPVGERRIASSATALFKVLPVSLFHGSPVAHHYKPLFSEGFQIK